MLTVCTSVIAGTITQPTQLTASSSAGTILGFGLTTTVNVTANGGTPAYTGTGIYTVTAGSYSYVVTDARGCQVIVTGTVGQPAPLVATAVNGSVTCFGGTATVAVTANGGVAPYTGTGTYTVNAGPYSYTVTDANGNTAVTSGNVAQPTLLNTTASTGTINCNGGTTTISIGANGGTSGYVVNGTGISGSSSMTNGAGVYTLAAGPYSYTVTDANGCTSVIAGTITQPTQLTASSSAGTILGFGLTTTVNVTANGGTPAYTGTGIYTVTAGSYSYVVTDARGCQVIVTGTVGQPALLVAASVHNSVICNGGTATVAVTANGGVAPYTGTGTYTVNAGPYSYTVTDANGNTAVTSGNVAQPTLLNTTASTGTINCNGGTTTISIGANGGTSGYVVNGTGISGSSSMTNGAGVYTLAAGPYSYTVTDANGCTSVIAGTITQPTQLTASSSAGTILGFGLTTTVNVTANGGTPAYTGTGIYTVTAGSYSYVVTDARGCQVIVTGTVGQPALLVAASVHNSVICNGGTATVAVTANGGVAPYTGTGTYTVNAGPYSYTVTDANGNTAVTSGNVAQPTLLNTTASTGTINCNGGTTTISIGANGGTSGYVVNGTGISGSSSMTNGAGVYTLAAGPYSYTVTDANGCTSVIAGTITQPTQLTASSSAGTILGFGLTTTVNVTANGGTPAYTGTGIYTVTAGSYSYVVTDARGCQVIVTGTVGQPALLVASSTNNTVICNGGTATVAVTANGGVAPYTGTGTYTVNAGPYSYTVTDANGNTAVTSGNVAQPTLLNTTASTGTINCNGGTTTISIGANGGTSGYVVNGTGISGSSSMTNGAGVYTLAAGPYSYTVTDANGCTSVIAGTITQPTQLTASSSAGTILGFGLTTTVNVTANGGTPAYTGTGIYTVTAGSYSYVVTDARGCQVIVTGTVGQPALLVAASVHNSVICNGGTATVAVTANGGVAPYTGTGTYTVNAGPYSYTVTDANGNTAVTSGNVAQPTLLNTTASTGTINCNGGTTTISIGANGGTSGYVVNGTGISGSSSMTNGAGVYTLAAGPYSYTVTDANGCTSVIAGTITQPTQLTASSSAGTILGFGLTTTVNVTANGGTPAYTGTGIYTVTAGSYSYVVTDARGCQVIVTGTVGQPAPLVATAVNGSVTCFGGTATVAVNATGGVPNYTGVGLYSDGGIPTVVVGSSVTTPGVYTISAGPYSFTVTDANGNTAIATGTIAEPPYYSITSSTGSISCFGQTTTINIGASGGTPGYSVNGTGITGSSALVNGVGVYTLAAGPYSYTVTDANGCYDIISGTITEPTQLNASLSNGIITGFGLTTTINVTANGGTPAYTGTGTYTVGAGVYTYTVTDANGCQVILTTTITQPALLIAASVHNSVICNGGTATVAVTANGGVGPYTGTGTYTVNAGPYSYTVTDANGNTAVTSGNVAQPTLLNTTASTGTINCFGTTTTISIGANGGTSGYVVNGTGISGSSNMTNGAGVYTLAAGPYSYTVTDANGCTSVIAGTITQPTQLTASSSAGTILGFGLTTTVNVTANGGTPAYTGTGIYTVTAGSYSYVVTDAVGCQVVVTRTVTQPAPLVATAVNGSVTCFGGTATVAVSATGGVPNYTGVGLYSDGGIPTVVVGSSVTTPGVYTISAGPYSFTVTDANGNTAIATGTIAEPPYYYTTSNTGALNCFGQTTTITIGANGGTPGYTVNGTGITGTSALVNGSGTYTLAGGPYSYTVTDANGCYDIISGTIYEPTQLNASLTTGTILGFGLTTTVNVTANGGTPAYTGTGIYTVTAGTYSYVVTDALGCQVILTTTLTQPAPLMASSVHGSVTCFGGSANVTVTATGGVGSYTGAGVYNVTAGAYSYTVTDGNGITAVTTGTVIEPTQFVVSSSVGSISCNAGTTTLNITATGGTPTYVNNGTFTLTAGAYNYLVSDANGCSSVVSGTITEPTALLTSLSTGSIACNGGTTTAVIAATGGVSPYTGTGSFVKLGGSHSYTVTDANGCISSLNYTISQPSLLQLTYVTDSIQCNGGVGNVTLTAIGGVPPYIGNVATYTLSGGNNQFFVQDAHGCGATASFVMPEPSPLNVVVSANSILCNGGITTATIIGTGGTAPYTGAGTFSVAAGTTTFAITDAHGCQKVDSVTIAEPLPLQLISCGHIRCKGDSAKVVITTTGGIAPFTGTGTLTLGPGNYTLVVSDSNACVATKTLSLVDPPTKLSVFASITPILCFGDSAMGVVTATGGVQPYYGDSTYYRGPGTYTYGVIDSLGCIDTGIVTITAPPQLVASAVMGVIPCLNSLTTVTVSATGGTAPYSGTGVNTVGSGSYTYNVTDANSCSTQVVMNVDTSSCLGFENLSFDEIQSTLVYPNPNNGNFVVLTQHTGKAMLISENGQLIKELNLEEETEIQVRDLARGLYFLVTPKERIKIAVTAE